MTDDMRKASGGCLCGAVRYRIRGKIRDVVNCHCSKCRRFHGNFAAYTSVALKDLELVEKRGLKWYKSRTDETSNVLRGFCTECGSSLFWHPKDLERISVAAGSLDEPTHLKTIAHIWISQIGDYYSIRDYIPRHEKGLPR